jgi:catechol-2,3-dioxygenase
LRIDEITLFTNTVQNQKHFYNNVLGFELVTDAIDKVSIKVGKSVLTFAYSQEFKPSHFAFNIPSNTITRACNWLENRVEILTYNNKPIVDFSSWNAKAIYFYDANKNIVEFIARRNLNINSSHPFSSTEVLSISEIGIATTNIEKMYNAINNMSGIPIFDGDFSSFCAVGNDEGLFILINKNEKKWFPTNDVAYTSDVIVKGDYNFAFKNGKIKELS